MDRGAAASDPAGPASRCASQRACLAMGRRLSRKGARCHSPSTVGGLHDAGGAVSAWCCDEEGGHSHQSHPFAEPRGAVRQVL